MASIPGVNQPSSQTGAGPASRSVTCGAEGVYNALLNAGFNTTQAIGLMANALNESGFNPEAVGDNGTSFGLWQFHEPGYAGASSLLTGNCVNDINSQVAYLKTHVSGSAFSGSTPSEVAGNVAANFEECVGCQPGGAQYNSRVANAATVAGWVSSGNWPVNSGSGVGPGSGTGSTGSTASTTSANPANCLIGFSGIPGTSWISDIFASGGNIGQACLFSKTEARALIGGGLIIVGAGFMMLSLVLATGAALAHTPAPIAKSGEVLGAGLALVPGLEAVGAGVAAGSKGINSASQHVQARRQARQLSSDEGSQTVREVRREPIDGEMGGTKTTTTTRVVRAPTKRRVRRAA